MKKNIMICASLFLVACTEENTPVVEAPPPPPEPIEIAEEPVVQDKPKPPEPRFQMSNIMGLERSTVESILGVPSLKRMEKQSEVWLYDNQFCNAHVYFYENDNSSMQVEYIETSEEQNLQGLEGQRADFCISTFLQD